MNTSKEIMVIFILFIGILEWIYNKREILEWVYSKRDKVSLIWFKLTKARKPALTHEEARNLAYIMLGGEILKAIPYLDFKNEHMKMAVIGVSGM